MFTISAEDSSQAAAQMWNHQQFCTQNSYKMKELCMPRFYDLSKLLNNVSLLQAACSVSMRQEIISWKLSHRCTFLSFKLQFSACSYIFIGQNSWGLLYDRRHWSNTLLALPFSESRRKQLFLKRKTLVVWSFAVIPYLRNCTQNDKGKFYSTFKCNEVKSSISFTRFGFKFSNPST